MAEGYFRAMAEEGGGAVEIGSAGIGAYDGQEPSTHSIVAMAAEGIDISRQRSRLLTPEMVERATHIFGMATSHRQAIQALFPESLEKVFVLREFVVDDDFDLDVPDPIGLDFSAYERTRNLIKEAMPSVLEFVLAHPGHNHLPEDDLES